MQKISRVFNNISIWQILLLALFLRLILINQSFWLDEASQAMTSMRSFSEIIFENNKDFHPPLMYVLTHFWIIFSKSEIWLRLLPVGFGVVTIYVGYLFAFKLFNKKVAMIFSLLLAIVPYHIYYSQEFRMYSLVTLLVMLSMYFFARLLKSLQEVRLPRRSFLSSRNDVIGYVLSSVLILYTHYLGGTIFVVQLLYLFLFQRNLLKHFLSYFLFIGLLFVPWLPQLFVQLQVGGAAESYLPGWSQMLSLSLYKAIPLLFVKFIIGRLDFDNNFIYLGLVLISFGVVGLALKSLKSRLNDVAVKLVMFWLLVPILLTFVISFKLPMFQPFRLLFCLPAFLLLIALGIESTKRYKTHILAAVVVLFLFCQSIFWFQPSFWREDWRTAVKEADGFGQNNGTVLFAWSTPFPTYDFYSLDNSGFGAVQKNPATFAEVDSQLLGMPLGSRVVVFDYLAQLTDPEGNIKKWLELHNYKLLEARDYRGIGFVHYYVSSEQLIGYY